MENHTYTKEITKLEKELKDQKLLYQGLANENGKLLRHADNKTKLADFKDDLIDFEKERRMKAEQRIQDALFEIASLKK